MFLADSALQRRWTMFVLGYIGLAGISRFFFLKRIVLAFLTTFIILSLTFILVKLLPFERPIGGDQQQIAYFDKQYQMKIRASKKI